MEHEYDHILTVLPSDIRLLYVIILQSRLETTREQAGMPGEKP